MKTDLNRMKTIFTFFLISFSLSVSSQVAGDIYLVDINRIDSGIVFSNLQNITQHKGYDNQPYFSSNNKFVYFTSIRKDSIADIYSYDLAKRVTKNLSNTP